MVGVASSNLVAPTKFGRKNKHLAGTLGAFFYACTGKVRQISPGALANLAHDDNHRAIA